MQGAAKFEKEKWHNELNPILNLWKKLNQGSSLLQMKMSAPSEQSSSDPIKSFVQLEFFNGVNLIQFIHKSMASLVKVIRGTQLLDEKVAQLAGSLMKQETPSRWQKIWDGPEDPMIYIKVVVEKANAVQSWNSAVEKGRLLKGIQVLTYWRQISLRIVGYHFSSRLTATLNLCPIYLKLLVHVL